MPKDSSRPSSAAQRRSLMVKHEVDSVPEEEAPEAGGAQLRLESGCLYRRKAENWEKQVKAMKVTITRLRMKAEAKTEEALDLRTELQQMRKDMEMMEREADKRDELLDAARKDTEQYRTWWLNEIQFMKLMLNKVPEPNKDIDLVRTAQAHYLGHY